MNVLCFVVTQVYTMCLCVYMVCVVHHVHAVCDMNVVHLWCVDSLVEEIYKISVSMSPMSRPV